MIQGSRRKGSSSSMTTSLCISRPFRCCKPKLLQPLLYSSPTCSIMLDRRGFETDVHLSLRIRLTAMQCSSFQKFITLSTMPLNSWLFLDCNLAWVWTRPKPVTLHLNKKVLKMENCFTTDFVVIHISLKYQIHTFCSWIPGSHCFRNTRMNSLL
jgi:hypothetical protein